jgi:hypothetical protein
VNGNADKTTCVPEKEGKKECPITDIQLLQDPTKQEEFDLQAKGFYLSNTTIIKQNGQSTRLVLATSKKGD